MCVGSVSAAAEGGREVGAFYKTRAPNVNPELGLQR